MTQAFNLSQLANNLDSTGRLDAADGLVNAVPVANGGTGATNATTARANLGVSAAEFSVPSGGIIMWSGAVGAIPSGWLLCNGLNGTPDLRNRFVVGAGGLYAEGANGGSADAIAVSHTHTASSTVNDTGHTHLQEYAFAGAPPGGIQAGGGVGQVADATPTSTSTTGITVSTTINSAGSSGTNANLPPYYALCFIMKS